MIPSKNQHLKHKPHSSSPEEDMRKSSKKGNKDFSTNVVGKKLIRLLKMIKQRVFLISSRMKNEKIKDNMRVPVDG